MNKTFKFEDVTYILPSSDKWNIIKEKLISLFKEVEKDLEARIHSGCKDSDATNCYSCKENETCDDGNIMAGNSFEISEELLPSLKELSFDEFIGFLEKFHYYLEKYLSDGDELDFNRKLVAGSH